jgi:hypothetical protein
VPLSGNGLFQEMSSIMSQQLRAKVVNDARLWEGKGRQHSDETRPRYAALLASLPQRVEARKLYAFVKCRERRACEHQAEVLVVAAQNGSGRSGRGSMGHPLLLQRSTPDHTPSPGCAAVNEKSEALSAAT